MKGQKGQKVYYSYMYCKIRLKYAYLVITRE
jgi:hypothetical protein